MQVRLKKAETRGKADYGWLKARHSFSFAQYQDRENMQFGALRVLNDDIIKEGSGFGKHPHDNMEIITIPLSGSLMHRDSMGHEEEIKENDVQVMSAGTGVFHSEFNASNTDITNILQLWIFPEERQLTPRYDQASFEVDGAKNKWQRLVSPVGNEGLYIHQQAYISRVFLDANSELEYKVNQENNKIYLFQVKGNARLNDIIIGAKDALEVSETSAFTICSMENSHLIAIEVPDVLK